MRVHTWSTRQRVYIGATGSTVCSLCHGKGHATSQVLLNGDKLYCITKVLEDIEARKLIDDAKDFKFRDKAQKYKEAHNINGCIGLRRLFYLKNRSFKLYQPRLSTLATFGAPLDPVVTFGSLRDVDARATYAGAEAAPVAHCGPQRTRMCFSTIMSHILFII